MSRKSNQKKDMLVSVVIPTYKRSNYIQRAVNSVIDQTYKIMEILIIDDNGAGNKYQIETEKKINELAKRHKNIKYILHNENRGAPAARNTGILNANGECIAFLDDDDYWKSNKIKEQVKFLDEYDIVLTGSVYINSQYKFPEFKKKEITADDLKKRNYGGTTSSLLIRKRVLIQYMFDIELKKSQDYDLYIRLSQNYRIKYINKPLVVFDYNIHRERITNQMLKTDIDICHYKEYYNFYDKHRDFFGEKKYKYHLAYMYLDSIALRKDKIKHIMKVVKIFGVYYPGKVMLNKLLFRFFGKP